MNSDPVFSVVIPTYHRNELLADCLACLSPQVQTLAADQYEVIVTDDGLETTAESLIREHYSWVKWVPGPRKGPAANRNNGAKYAQGKWLVFTDDDCLPTSQWLSEFVAAITSDILVYEGKTTCKAGITSPLEYAPVNLTGNCLWSCNLMIAAHVFQQLGGFDENFPYPHAEDQDFAYRLEKAGCPALFVEKAEIDHPPRRQRWGAQLGRLQESSVRYWRYTRGYSKPLFKIRFLRTVVKHRLQHILSCPLSFDSLKAMGFMVEEIFFIATHIREWDRKYSCSK
jgi:GT2 family glycosyltransferase